MKKIIFALAFICLVLPGCTEQEQEVYDKYSDAEYLTGCYDNSKTTDELCSCLGGNNILKSNSYGAVICANDKPGGNADIRESDKIKWQN